MNVSRYLLGAGSVAGLGAALLLTCASREHPSTKALDPAKTDADKYQVILENAQVRVLRYHDAPGAKTHPHHHPQFVLYALGPFRRQLTFPDGSVKVRDFQLGDVAWMPAQDHVGENVGTTPTEALLVEVK
jgi:beta-alanine degradation protein BauB